MIQIHYRNVIIEIDIRKENNIPVLIVDTVIIGKIFKIFGALFNSQILKSEYKTTIFQNSKKLKGSFLGLQAWFPENETLIK